MSFIGKMYCTVCGNTYSCMMSNVLSTHYLIFMADFVPFAILIYELAYNIVLVRVCQVALCLCCRRLASVQDQRVPDNDDTLSSGGRSVDVSSQVSRERLRSQRAAGLRCHVGCVVNEAYAGRSSFAVMLQKGLASVIMLYDVCILLYTLGS